MNLPPKLKTLIDEPITLDDFPEEEFCHACHGAEDGCVACRLNQQSMERFDQWERWEQMENER